MISLVTEVTLAFIALAMVPPYALAEFTTLPTWAHSTIVIGVGVLALSLVNYCFDRRMA